MRSRSLLVAALLGAVMLALGALLVARLLPAQGGDGPVEPVILSPAGLAVDPSDGTAPTARPSATADAPTTRPTMRPSPRATPEPVRPTPRDVDDDDDDPSDEYDDDDD